MLIVFQMHTQNGIQTKGKTHSDSFDSISTITGYILIIWL